MQAVREKVGREHAGSDRTGEGYEMDYKKAGVDIEAGYKAVGLMKEHMSHQRCVPKY